MSGDFYQRYIPPAPQKDTVQKSTEYPRSQFFTRYVPPPAPTVESETQIDAEAPPAKRPKVDRLPRREKKRPVKEISPEPSGGFDRHQSLKEKFSKAQKRSENRKEREGAQEPDDEAPTSTPSPAVKKHGLEPLPQPVDNVVDDVSQSVPLPGWLAEPIKAKQDSHGLGFDSLSLSSKTRKALRKRGYEKAFAVQETVVPLLLPGKERHRGDLCVAASTGSGKTLSYVLPMVEALRKKPVRLLRGLIVVPTRELVNQVRETLELCSAGSGLTIGISAGNRTLAEEKKQLLERRLKYDPAEFEIRKRKHNDPTVQDVLDWDPDDSEDEYNTPEGFIAAHASAVDILICTPGRLVDHIRSTKGFSLHDVQWLVIDEADKLLDQSFQQWIETVMPELRWMKTPNEKELALRNFLHIPQERLVQKVVLSATMTRDISKLLSLELVNPRLVVLEGQKKSSAEDEGTSEPVSFELPSTLQETAVTLGRNGEKPLALVELLEELLNGGSKDTSADTSESESDEGGDDSSDSGDSTSSSGSDSDGSTTSSGSDSSGASSASGSDVSSPELHDSDKSKKESDTRGILVFANTNEAAQRLSRLLGLMKREWRSLIGALTKSTASSSGRKLLSQFRSGKLQILVASDRASRGLDIENLGAVVNYDMPTSLMNYVHRVGRTARAGQRGTAYTVVAHHEGRWFWKEIGKTEKAIRAVKVVRREGLGKEIPEAAKKKYEEALKILGEEARGSK